MKLQLNKKKLKNLSKDSQILPDNMTPNIGGGRIEEVKTNDCVSCFCRPSDLCPATYNCM